jgi:hypothetical protein
VGWPASKGNYTIDDDMKSPPLGGGLAYRSSAEPIPGSVTERSSAQSDGPDIEELTPLSDSIPAAVIVAASRELLNFEVRHHFSLPLGSQTRTLGA